MTDKNALTYERCFSLGQKLRNELSGTWKEMVGNPNWIKFAKDFSDNQIYYIKRGFSGKEFLENELSSKPGADTLDDDLFPFGKHKGKRFGELSNNYVKYLAEQDWLPKWPTVASYVARRMGKIKDATLSKDEVANLLKME